MQPKSLHAARGTRGVTLIETLTVVAVTAVLAMAAVPTMSAVIENRRIDGMAAQLAADVHYARSEAVARQQPVRLSMLGTCYLVHTGAARDCRCMPSQQAECTAGAHRLKAVAWDADAPVRVQANVSSIAFDPTLGTASPAGTLRVVGHSERAVHHVVNLVGRLRSCSLQGRVPGYRAC
jgi:type IV fimbrial biogenesis protein FimT